MCLISIIHQYNHIRYPQIHHPEGLIFWFEKQLNTVEIIFDGSSILAKLILVMPISTHHLQNA